MKTSGIFIFILILFALLALLPSGHVYAAEDAFTLTYKDQTFSVSDQELSEWKGRQTLAPSKILNLAPANFKSSLLVFVGQEPQNNTLVRTYNHHLGSIYNFVEGFSDKINTDLQEPTLKIENNLAVEFTPPKDGLKVDVYKTALNTLNALELGKKELGVVVYDTKPQNSLATLNDLGINELISTGISGFKGSPNNRRHNINVGISKFKGIIIQKGEEFSFNKYLGPVEKEQGFLPELVIKRTGTVPELGGGLCQVSSTTFRAAMEAGLPITERRNHAYAVQYYSPQGTDATIYPGIVDLKFINDTPGAILIWPYLKDKDTLIFEFYGSKDGRKVTLQKPIQYDRKSDGSMKAEWTRLVEKNGETASSTFKSVYQPPALFHKQEQFVSAAPPPAGGPTPTPGGLQMP